LKIKNGFYGVAEGKKGKTVSEQNIIFY